jgi:hypothetical protein
LAGNDFGGKFGQVAGVVSCRVRTAHPT